MAQVRFLSGAKKNGNIVNAANILRIFVKICTNVIIPTLYHKYVFFVFNKFYNVVGLIYFRATFVYA